MAGGDRTGRISGNGPDKRRISNREILVTGDCAKRWDLEFEDVGKGVVSFERLKSYW